jgi:hypothetical protein
MSKTKKKLKAKIKALKKDIKVLMFLHKLKSERGRELMDQDDLAVQPTVR